MVARKPGGPRSRGVGKPCGLPEPWVRSEAVVIGVQFEPAGLEKIWDWVVWVGWVEAVL